MNTSCRIETSAEGAEKFIKHMQDNGFTIIKNNEFNGWAVVFAKDGQISLDYEVIKLGSNHFVGIRPT